MDRDPDALESVEGPADVVVYEDPSQRHGSDTQANQLLFERVASALGVTETLAGVGLAVGGEDSAVVPDRNVDVVRLGDDLEVGEGNCRVVPLGGCHELGVREPKGQARSSHQLVERLLGAVEEPRRNPLQHSGVDRVKQRDQFLERQRLDGREHPAHGLDRGWRTECHRTLRGRPRQLAQRVCPQVLCQRVPDTDVPARSVSDRNHPECNGPCRRADGVEPTERQRGRYRAPDLGRGGVRGNHLGCLGGGCQLQIGAPQRVDIRGSRQHPQPPSVHEHLLQRVDPRLALGGDEDVKHPEQVSGICVAHKTGDRLLGGSGATRLLGTQERSECVDPCRDESGYQRDCGNDLWPTRLERRHDNDGALRCRGQKSGRDLRHARC
ncbi:unannotated protein [freshwater metagenome]|uniref:Unannotated protein n=1 Tax=freshwater metagenome TaxID=449393 RepID=A0A6J6SCP9_9ZZZZ